MHTAMVKELSSHCTHIPQAKLMGEGYANVTYTLITQVQFILCERGGAVDGGVPHVDVGHPHDSPHTSLVILQST